MLSIPTSKHPLAPSALYQEEVKLGGGQLLLPTCNVYHWHHQTMCAWLSRSARELSHVHSRQKGPRTGNRRTRKTILVAMESSSIQTTVRGRNEVFPWRWRKYTGRSLEGQGTDRVFRKVGGFCRMAVFHGRSVRRCSSAADRRSQLCGVVLVRRCTEVVYDSVLRWEPPERLANLTGQAERSVFTGPWTGLKPFKSLKNQTDCFPGGLHWGLQAFCLSWHLRWMN